MSTAATTAVLEDDDATTVIDLIPHGIARVLVNSAEADPTGELLGAACAALGYAMQCGVGGQAAPRPADAVDPGVGLSAALNAYLAAAARIDAAASGRPWK